MKIPYFPSNLERDLKATRETLEENKWQDRLVKTYETEPRTGMHVSDLTLCLRQTALSRLHKPVWEEQTLYRFTMGRAMEKSFFSLLIPESTQELSVEKDGIVGHIDFAGEEIDYECKLTWGKEPQTAEQLFTDKFYWVDQAGAYTHMRGRTQMNFVVCFLNPIPRLRSYTLTWDEYELEVLWARFLDNKEYIEVKNAQDELPMKTPLTGLCRGCAYKEVCDES